jgi:type VI secretion system secreted protein Hcp
MAYEAYMGINGEKQGQFKGQSSKGIPILSFDLAVASPRDAATGQASGRRQHKPVVIEAAWGNWSPQIFAAMTMNEKLTSVNIQIQDGAGGATGSDDWIRLKNAYVSKIHMHSSATGQSQEIEFVYETIEIGRGSQSVTDSWAQLENFAFKFQNVTFGSEVGKSVAADDWRRA